MLDFYEGHATKDEASAVVGAEACVKRSQAKASSYDGLQAAATVGGTEEGRGCSMFAIHTVLQSSKDLKKKHVKCY